MRILRSKAFWGIICIILAVGVFVGSLALQQSALSDLAPAVRMTANVSAGTRITAEMVERVSVSASMTAGVLTETEQVVGQYAVSDMYQGDFVTASKLSSVESTENVFAIATENGKRIVSVTVPTLASDVSGRLQPGDIVTVAAYVESSVIEDYRRTTVTEEVPVEPDENEPANDDEDAPTLTETVVVAQEMLLTYDKRTFIPEGLERMEVAFVATDNAADADVETHPSSEDLNELPATVAFYATEEQALALAELEQTASIHLIFVSRGVGGEG